MKLGPHTIVRLRATQVASDYGTGTQADWTDPDRQTIKFCSVQPAAADEYSVDRSSALTRWQVWADQTADVLASDRVEWNGQTYDVDGTPQVWDFPPLHHLTFNLVRSEEAPS